MLAHVQPGRHARLTLTDEQRHALTDPDGRLLRRVLPGFLHARNQATHPDCHVRTFPLTAPVFQQIARKLGIRPVPGIKHCRALIERAKSGAIMAEDGAYTSTKPIAHLVPVYRLLVRLRVRPVRQPPSQTTRGREAPVKVIQRVRWWEHALFGTPDRAPPDLPGRRTAAQMWAKDELRGGVLVGLRSVTVDGVVVR